MNEEQGYKNIGWKRQCEWVSSLCGTSSEAPLSCALPAAFLMIEALRLDNGWYRMQAACTSYLASTLYCTQNYCRLEKPVYVLKLNCMVLLNNLLKIQFAVLTGYPSSVPRFRNLSERRGNHWTSLLWVSIFLLTSTNDEQGKTHIVITVIVTAYLSSIHVLIPRVFFVLLTYLLQQKYCIDLVYTWDTGIQYIYALIWYHLLDLCCYFFRFIRPSIGDRIRSCTPSFCPSVPFFWLCLVVSVRAVRDGTFASKSSLLLAHPFLARWRGGAGWEGHSLLYLHPTSLLSGRCIAAS